MHAKKKNSRNTSLIPVGTQSLIRLGNSLAITEKLVKSNELRILNTFFQELNLNIELKEMPEDDFFLLQNEYDFDRLVDIIFKINDKKNTIKNLNNLYNINPNNTVYILFCGLMEQLLDIVIDKELPFDVDYYRKSIELNSLMFFPKYLLCRLLYQDGNENESRDLMISCINFIDNSLLNVTIKVKMLTELAELCELNVSFFEMEQCYKALIKLNQNELDYYLLASFASYKYGDYDLSIRYANKFLKLKEKRGASIENGWWFKNYNKK